MESTYNILGVHWDSLEVYRGMETKMEAAASFRIQDLGSGRGCIHYANSLAHPALRIAVGAELGFTAFADQCFCS